MKKKKIFLNGRFLTKQLTGVQRVAFELVLALDGLIGNKDIDAGLFSFELIFSGEIINEITLKHIRLVRRGFTTGNIWEQFELPFYTAGNLLVSLCTISTLFKRKQLVMVHDASFFVNPAFFSAGLRAWYRLAIPLLAKISRGMITVSKFSRNELIKYGHFKPDRTHVIYNGADHILRFEDPEITFIKRIESFKPYCLAVSSLSVNKNFDLIGQAIKNIDFSASHMLVAGGVTNTLSYSSVPENILQLGYVSNAELKYLYANAELFIFPSLYEGFGIPPLEAMAMGCPVMSSFTSCLPEILGDACDYFHPKDDRGLAIKINLLINNPDKRRNLSERGKLHVAKYTWKKSAVQLFSLIEQYCD